MKIELDINSKEINEHIAEKVLCSSMGDAIKIIILKEINKLSSAYYNPLETEVRDGLVKIAKDFIINEFRSDIENAIRESFDDTRIRELTEEMVSNISFNGND